MLIDGQFECEYGLEAYDYPDSPTGEVCAPAFPDPMCGGLNEPVCTGMTSMIASDIHRY